MRTKAFDKKRLARAFIEREKFRLSGADEIYHGRKKGGAAIDILARKTNAWVVERKKPNHLSMSLSSWNKP